MAELDLDKRRAEANKEPHELTLGGETYPLPAELPLLFADHLANGRLREAINIMFGPENGEVVFPLLYADDLNVIAQDLYGLGDTGKSPVSADSLNRNGRRSKRTSNASTAST